jgi:hypothetical protein
MKIILKTFATSTVSSIKKSKVKPGDKFQIYNEEETLMGTVYFNEWTNSVMNMEIGEFEEFYRMYIMSDSNFWRNSGIFGWLDKAKFKVVGRDTLDHKHRKVSYKGKKYPWISKSLDEIRDTLFAVLTAIEEAGGKVVAPS